MQEHTASAADIEALFANETIALDGGNASSHIVAENAQSSRETISLTGARTMVEELSKRLPKVEWGEF